MHRCPARLARDWRTSSGSPELAAVIDKVTAAPAKVFGTQPDLDGAWIVVDPNATVPGSSWPGQAPDRTPYLGRELTGAVRAIGADGYGFAL
jgi:dihydroorotase-like cyclic amidohydrolase